MGDRIAAYNGADYGFRVIAALGAIPALVSGFAVLTVAAMERGEKVKGSTGRRVLYGLAGFSMVAGSAGFAFANPFQGVPRHS